ncbi:MAG: DUF1552 domain-containing protein [Myxococcota bacterium]
MSRVVAIDRRTVLRGLFGVSVALPTLEIMLHPNGEALAGGDPLPKRFLYGFAGCALGCDGDEVHNLFVPDAIGPGYDLKTGTASLANHGNVKDQVTIVSGLRIPYDTGSGIPAGGWWREFHIEALGPLLSGVRGQYPQDYGVNGVTADQVVGAAIGAGTAFPSLQYQVQAAWYLTESAPYGRDVISYRRDGSGNLIAVPGQISPKAAYDALFTAFVPPDDTEAQAKARELLKRRSVVDLVRDDFQTLIPQVGRADQIRLERHLDEIRELERQLELESPDITETCFQYPDPGPDPTVGGAQQAPSGAEFDVNLGWSDETTRAKRFADLVAMAYTCDLTRSVALLYTMAQSHMNVYAYSGQPYDQHELGHSYLGTETFSVVPDWHVDQFGYLVAKLRDTPEGAGTVLDNAAMVLVFEAGHGYDPATGDPTRTHSTENMAVCTAGGAGGLRQGEHVVATGMHPVHVVNTAMRAVGVDQDLGEVVGVVPGLT